MSTRTRTIELDQEPGFAGGERSEPVGRAERTAGGALIAGGLAAPRPGRELSQELVEDGLDRVRAGLPIGELPAEVRERLTDGLIDELLGGARGEREILGPGGLLGELTRRLVERALGAELTEPWATSTGRRRRAGRATRATARRPRRS